MSNKIIYFIEKYAVLGLILLGLVVITLVVANIKHL